MLIVDDHPIICNSYKDAFEEVSAANENLHIQVDVALDCDSAREKINNRWVEKGYDLVLLDIRLPASRDRKLVSGEDLGELIREVQPEARIIVATTFNDNFRMQNIIRSLNPEGFLIKNDLDTGKHFAVCIGQIRRQPMNASAARSAGVGHEDKTLIAGEQACDHDLLNDLAPHSAGGSDDSDIHGVAIPPFRLSEKLHLDVAGRVTPDVVKLRGAEAVVRGGSIGVLEPLPVVD